MKNGSIFRKFLIYLLCACLSTALLAVIIYAYTGADLFARRIADEMTPRAYGVARLASRFQTGQVSYDSFIDFALQEQQGTSIYIFDRYGNMLAYSAGGDVKKHYSFLQASAASVLETGAPFTSARWRSENGIMVGVPITDNMRRITGVILMSKPTNEVREAMGTLVGALAISCLAVSLAMLLPVYLISRRISDPIRRMTDASAAMANGDFSVWADENSNDEIGRLGQALNHLSAQLHANISDLVSTRNRLHVILGGLHEGVVALNHDGEPVYCNPSALSLLHCRDESELADKLRFVRPVCLEVSASGQSRSVQLVEQDSKLMLVVSPSQHSGDAAPDMIVVIQDVTAAERLEQTRRDYVANVSHELRTPIASIRSLAETLNDGLIKTEDDRFRYYGYILRESMRLSRLINDLLELSRLQSNAVALEKETFSLNTLLDEVVARMRTTASYSGISVSLTMPDGADCPAFSNRDRIEQVLVALIDNAIKFASDNGKIIVNLKRAGDGGRAFIEVRNTGHIREQDLAYLFERFYKADSAHSDGGTGLGLAIVQETLTLLGEQITVQNDGEYVLFCFSVALQTEASS